MTGELLEVAAATVAVLVVCRLAYGRPAARRRQARAERATWVTVTDDSDWWTEELGA